MGLAGEGAHAIASGVYLYTMLRYGQKRPTKET